MLAKLAHRRRFSVKVAATRNSVLQCEWSRAICVSRCSVPLEPFVEFVLPIEWIGFDCRAPRQLSSLPCCCCIPVSTFPRNEKTRSSFIACVETHRPYFSLDEKEKDGRLFPTENRVIVNDETVLQPAKKTIGKRALAWRRDSRDVPCRYVAVCSEFCYASF